MRKDTPSKPDGYGRGILFAFWMTNLKHFFQRLYLNLEGYRLFSL
jgi:hypothetical protein